jgi:hypothetical protein
MRESLQAAIAEGKAPTHCCAGDVADQLRPVITVALKAQKQVAYQRELLVTASLEDPTYDGNTEKIEQTLKSIEKRSATIIAEARGLRDDLLQLERYSGQVEADVTTHIELLATQAKALELEAAKPEVQA